MWIILHGIIIILLWVGAWGIMEMFVDDISGENKQLRFSMYTIFLIIGGLLLWIITVIN